MEIKFRAHSNDRRCHRVTSLTHWLMSTQVKAWMEFMFETRVKGQMVYETLLPIKRTRRLV